MTSPSYILSTVKRYLKNPFLIFEHFNQKYDFRFLSDKIFLSLKFRALFGEKLNLKNPRSYSEKLQWLKLYDRNPIYSDLVDKYKVKEIIAKKIGEEHIIPTLKYWASVDDIDFDVLPDQFVLKCTHDSGGLIICTDKKQLDIEKAKKKLKNCMERNFFWKGREWPYKNVKPGIIAEKFMVDDTGYELRDYKFFCFNGVPKLMFIASDRQVAGEDTKFDFYDMDFNILDFTNGHPKSGKPIQKPKTFETMKQLAGVLAKNIPHVRVDFYEIDGKVYFGEMTFFHHSGFTKFDPPEWDLKIGKFISLPEKNR